MEDNETATFLKKERRTLNLSYRVYKNKYLLLIRRVRMLSYLLLCSTSGKPNLPTYIGVKWGPTDRQTDRQTDRPTLL